MAIHSLLRQEIRKIADMTERVVYIIAGCNGAGKTTASFTLLPQIIPCLEFINADEIARGISPFTPESASIEAGRVMLDRINTLLYQGQTFAFETTLSANLYLKFIHQARQQGYRIILLYFWLENSQLAKERVRIRVLEGGHNISDEVIERRYIRGLQNLFSVYLQEVDGAFLFDNSIGQFELIAMKSKNHALIEISPGSVQKIKSSLK